MFPCIKTWRRPLIQLWEHTTALPDFIRKCTVKEPTVVQISWPIPFIMRFYLHSKVNHNSLWIIDAFPFSALVEKLSHYIRRDGHCEDSINIISDTRKSLENCVDQCDAISNSCVMFSFEETIGKVLKPQLHSYLYVIVPPISQNSKPCQVYNGFQS